jgi:hypothetical protein
LAMYKFPLTSAPPPTQTGTRTSSGRGEKNGRGVHRPYRQSAIATVNTERDKKVDLTPADQERVSFPSPLRGEGRKTVKVRQAPKETWRVEGGSQTRPYVYSCQFGMQREYSSGQKARGTPRLYKARKQGAHVGAPLQVNRITITLGNKEKGEACHAPTEARWGEGRSETRPYKSENGAHPCAPTEAWRGECSEKSVQSNVLTLLSTEVNG